MRALVFALICSGAALADNEAMKKGRAHYRLGLAHQKSGSYALAAEEFQAAYTLAPLPEYLAYLGDAQRQAGNTAAALEAYKRYLDADPDGKLADEVARQVATLSKVAPPPPPPPPPPPAAPPPAASVYDFGGSAAGSYPAGGTTSAPSNAPAIIVHTTPGGTSTPEPPRAVERVVEPPRPRPRWLWPVVGGVAGGVVVVVVLGVGLGVGLANANSFTYGTVEIR